MPLESELNAPPSYRTDVTVAFGHYTSESDERWQSKEFDGEHGKYYFGARYYDPFFGMWISPDPAGQFANPYSYGGDPLNYIDPTGMWAMGLGLVVGYNKSSGWSVGVGAAAEVGDVGVNASLSFNQDGSKSLNTGANLKIPIQTPVVYIEINLGLGFSMNSYSGATLSTHGGVCVGEAGNCVGMEQGGSLYFDRSGGFSGMTVYTEMYLQIAGEGRISTGYEAGLLGAEGRGAYAGASAFGVHAEVSQNGGTSWGFQRRFSIFNYTKTSHGHMSKLFEYVMDVDYSLAADGGYYPDPETSEDREILSVIAKLVDDNNDDVYTFVSHGDESGFCLDAACTIGKISAQELASRLKKGGFNYKNQKTIVLLSCNTGKGDNSAAQQLANAMEGVKVIAPNAYVNVKHNKFPLIGIYPEADIHLSSEEGGSSTGAEKWRTFSKLYSVEF